MRGERLVDVIVICSYGRLVFVCVLFGSIVELVLYSVVVFVFVVL